MGDQSGQSSIIEVKVRSMIHSRVYVVGDRSQQTGIFPHGIRLFGTPWESARPPEEGPWIGKLAELIGGEDGKRVVTLVAAGGGVALREQVWKHLHSDGLLRLLPPDGLFWWTFGADPYRGVAACLAEVVTSLSRGEINGRALAPDACAEAIAVLADAGRYLLVFDGVERLLHKEGARRGTFLSEHEALRRSLDLLALARGGSLALLLSLVPLLDLPGNLRVGMVQDVR